MAEGEFDNPARIRFFDAILKQLVEEEKLKMEKEKQTAQGEQPALPVVMAAAVRDGNQKESRDGQETGPAAGSQLPQKGKAPPSTGERQSSPGVGQRLTAGSPRKMVLVPIEEGTEPEEEEDSPPRPTPKAKRPPQPALRIHPSCVALAVSEGARPNWT